MNIKQTILLLLLITALPLSSFKASKPATNYYGFLYIEGKWASSHNTLVSRVFYRSTDCTESHADFWRHAQEKFFKHVQANYNENLDHNGNSAIGIVSYKNVDINHDSYTTNTKAQSDLDDMVISQKKQGYGIKYVSWTYSCGDAD
jgi:hypothetical protein